MQRSGFVGGPKLLETLGAEVISINVTPNGSFPRPAEPVAENLGDLSTAVTKHGANIGFTQDMDADRLAIVSEKGMPIGEDYTLLLATLYVLGKQLGPVVANLSSTSALQDVAKRFNCPVFLTRIGEVNVTEVMQRENAVIGGEETVALSTRASILRDSLVGMAVILHLLAGSGTVTEMNDLPAFSMIKDKLVCPSDKISAVLRMLRHEYAGHPLDVRDGVKVVLPSGWFLLRGSNTEPLFV